MGKTFNTSSSSRPHNEEFLKELLTWEKFFTVLPDALLCVDDEGKILCANKKAEEIFGYESRELIGQSIESLIPMNIRDKHPHYRKSYARKPTPRLMGAGLKLFGLRKNGETFPADISLNHLIISGKMVVFALIRDITDILKTERALHEKEKEFQLTIKGIDEIIYSVKIDGEPNKGIVQLITGRVEEILGIKPEEFINDPGLWFSLIHPDDVPDVVEQTNNLVKEKKRIIREHRIRNKKSDSYIWIEDKVFPQLDDSGNVVGLFGVACDITERKTAVEQLKIQATILKNVHDSVIATNLDGKIAYWNKGAEQIFGYTAEEMLGKTPQLLYPQDSKFDLKTELVNLQDEEIITHEWKGLRKDKTEIWVNSKRTLMRNSKGENSGYMGISRDITERKIVEEEIKKLSLVAKHTYDVVIITDPDRKIEWANNGFIKVTGYTLDEAKGKKPSFLQGPDTDPNTIVYLRNQISKQLSFHCEILNYKKTGEKYWIETSGQPLFDESGKLIKWFSVEREITERKKAVEELIAAKEKAEEMNRLKSNFFANMSHELRTPLIAILGYAQIIKSEDENPEFKEMAEGIETSGNRLLETFETILHFSKIESEKLHIDFEEVDITNTTRAMVASYEQAAKKKNLYLTTSVTDERLFSRLDKEMFEYVIGEIINNAIKYTQKGGISVVIGKKKILDGDWGVIDVNDTGEGITKEGLELIFEEFRQVSEGLNRQHEGIGLGLTVVKKFTELMGGNIEVKSEIGKGSTFSVQVQIITE